jgi:hypothetical protein
MPGRDGGRDLRFRRRDDYAVDLFRQVLDHLDDSPRVDRALLELGRFYNPVANAPIVDLATRRQVLELIEAGRHQEARQILNQRLSLYAGTGDEGSGAGSPCPTGAQEERSDP